MAAELGRGCGSAAWYYGVWAADNWIVGTAQGAVEIFQAAMQTYSTWPLEDHFWSPLRGGFTSLNDPKHSWGCELGVMI